MKEVKTPTSSSYHDYLISSLKNPLEAAGYIEVMLELEDDPNPEPVELLRSALKDAMEARVLSDNLSDEAKLHFEKLDKMLLETKGAEIFGWLSCWMHWDIGLRSLLK
ncbi:MAG: transcriptional regulator [Heteroscytonema crispum UTEX LB 1556]